MPHNNVKHLEVTGATLVQGTSATLTVANTTLNNRDRCGLRYNVTFTDAIGTEPLLITTNGTTYPVLSKLGNPVAIGKLRRREPLYLVFSNITSTTPAVSPHFTLCNDIHCQCIVTPPIAATAAATVAATIKS
jgi:hypothetical protein